MNNEVSSNSYYIRAYEYNYKAVIDISCGMILMILHFHSQQDDDGVSREDVGLPVSGQSGLPLDMMVVMRGGVIQRSWTWNHQSQSLSRKIQWGPGLTRM